MPSGSDTCRARCSAARRSATAAIRSREGVTNAAPLASATLAMGARGKRLELQLELATHGARHQVGRANEERVRGLVVLGLREEIGRDEARIGLVVRHDDDLAGASDAVDVDRAEDQTLGAGDVEVAGPDDLGHAGNALRAVGERGDRLRAARVDDGGHPGEVGGRVDRVVALVAGKGRREDDLLDASHGGRDRRHEDARRIPRLASGRVDSGAGDGQDAEPEGDPRLFVPKAGVALVLVKGADARRRELHRGAHVRREAREGGGAGVLAREEARRAPAEALVVALDRRVPLGTDGGEDLANRGLDPLEIALAPRLEAPERPFEPGRTLHERREHDAKSVASREMPRSAMRALPAMLILVAVAGCPHAPPCDGVSCTAACPRDSAIDASGRCACAEGDVPLLGACVPPPVGEAFCGPAARIASEGATSGCVFRSCGAGQSLDVVSGACVPQASLAHDGSIECREPAVALVEAGRTACVAPAAACPRGTTPGSGEGKGGKRTKTCERPLPCPPGSLAEGSTCRPIVTLGGRGGNRVDVGAWAALALGIHGGPGAAALCQPLAQHPGAFERGPGAGVPPGDGGGQGDGGAPTTVRVAVAIMLPDQDVSRLHAEVRARDADDHPLSTAAEAVVSGAVGTLVEALRGLGGEASAASVELEVTCAVLRDP